MINYANVDLYFSIYSNYFDRIARREPEDLYAVSVWPTMPIRNVKNFTPGDGIETVQIMRADQMNYGRDIPNPNYLFVTNAGELQIQQRWFVMECDRTRRGEWVCRLRRDVVSESLEKLLTAPVYVRKGWINDPNDPAIYNDEGMLLNQIKIGQHTLHDYGYWPWIVGYIAKPSADQGDITVQTGPLEEGDITIYKIEDLDGYEFFSGGFLPSAKAVFLIYGKERPPSILQPFDVLKVYSGNYERIELDNDKKTSSALSLGSQKVRIAGSWNAWRNLAPDYAPIPTESQISRLQRYNGRTVLETSTNKLYQMSVSTSESSEEYKIASGSLFDLMSRDAAAVGIYGTPDSTSFAVEMIGSMISVEIKEIDRHGTLTATIPTGRRRCTDSPYDIFAIPYADCALSYATTKDITISKRLALTVASDICEAMGSSLYDCQIVPVNPVGSNAFGTPTKLSLSSDLTNSQKLGINYTEIKDSANKVYGLILFLDSSSGSGTISTRDSEFNPRVSYKSAIEKKVALATETWRITSPNYAASFEFSPAKNGGTYGLNVSYTLKPGTPYIRVAPLFGGLYGGDYRDARGLILAGDFSITRTTDQYQEYVLNNKNFELIFNRQIENLGVVQEEELRLKKFSAAAGVITGGAAGMMSGAQVGGGAGAVVGAGVGAAASIAGASLDLSATRRLHEEEKDYRQDMFNMNIQNIKARPDTLTRVSAYNVDNTYLPYIEIYRCTDTEAEAFRNKLKYEGMKIGRVGRLEEFLNSDGMTFVQGTLIRAEGIEDDAHYATALAKEIEKGVYIE